ncbi:hypothetical protein [Streptomyces yanii]|uniref:Uncharacterized protein n=1 Tax=Streptomyces yanii TaxID=78510 RepID=A0ABV5RKZ2_9ACTN
MTDLTAQIIKAHGGLDRYNEYETATVDFHSGGALWGLKGQEAIFDRAAVQVDLRRQHASHYPFREPGLRTSFSAGRVAIETDEGEVRSERLSPRDAFAGHTLNTPWDDLHVAYFAGYAMWTYLTSPFTFASPSFRTEELSPVIENGEEWSRLKVTFPDDVATHSQEQLFYFGSDGLLRRHDYTAEVINAGPAAHYASHYAEFDGIMVPTKRRVYPLGEDGVVVRDIELVTIDVENVTFA